MLMPNLSDKDVSIVITVPEFLKDEYKEAFKYLGVNRNEAIIKYIIHTIGQVNKLKRLEKQEKNKEYMELLLKLIKGKEDV